MALSQSRQWAKTSSIGAFGLEKTPSSSITQTTNESTEPSRLTKLQRFMQIVDAALEHWEAKDAFLRGSTTVTLSIPQLEWFAESWFEGRLAELATFEDNWDSYGGLKPSKRAIETAFRLVLGLSDDLHYLGEFARLAEPAEAFPLASGGVELEWQFGNTLFAVEISPDGKLNTMTRTSEPPDANYHLASDVSDAFVGAQIKALIGSEWK